MIKIFLFLLLVAGIVHAENLKTVFNPFTGKPDYITAVTCSNNNNGFQLVDTSSCTWCETVSTNGVIVASLIKCPSTNLILREDGTDILQEDGTKILLE